MKVLSVIMFFSTLLLFSCKKVNHSIIKNAEIGFNLLDSVYIINNHNIITNGIVFPNNNVQTNQQIISSIQFRFSTEKSTEKLYYKIYYQNETYKFSEDDSLSYENFYGSWYDTTGFKEINAETVLDSFIIAGNPRFEKRY